MLPTHAATTDISAQPETRKDQHSLVRLLSLSLSDSDAPLEVFVFNVRKIVTALKMDQKVV
jgi:hypothetical protein